MSPFDYLLLAHLIGDYPFQTRWMAMNKSSRWSALLLHSLVYTLTLTVIAWWGFGGLTAPEIFLILISHAFLDQRRFVKGWVKHIMRTMEKDSGWLTIMVDQVFHLIMMAYIAS